MSIKTQKVKSEPGGDSGKPTIPGRVGGVEPLSRPSKKRLPDGPRLDEKNKLGQEVDLEFVRSFYPETSSLSDKQIPSHVKSANLFVSAKSYCEAVRQKGLLPADFAAVDYQMVNGDLRGFTKEWQLVKHYTENGTSEGRSFHRKLDPIFYQQLYFGSLHSISFSEIETHWKGRRTNFANVHEALAASGFESSHWLARFDAQSYLVTNALVDKIENIARATVHFLSLGMSALYPISEALRFDPNFYRCRHAEPEGASTDVECYRRWLEHGLLVNEPPNESAFVISLGLESGSIPANFDFEGYAANRSHDADSAKDRWSVFEHYVRCGVHEISFVPLKDHAAAASLLREIGDHHVRCEQQTVAWTLYERALLLNPSDAKLMQHVADLSLREGKYARALRFYRAARDLGQSAYWTFFNGGTAALKVELSNEALDWCESGLRVYPRSNGLIALANQAAGQSLAFTIREHIAAVRAGDRTAHAFSRAVRTLFDRLLVIENLHYGHDITAVPNAIQQPVSGTDRLRVLMLANEDLPQCTNYRVRQKAYQAEMGAFSFRSFPRTDTAGFLDACVDADIAIFYRLAVDIGTLRCLAACQRLGIPTFYEIDDLVFSADHFPDRLDSYGTTITDVQHFELECGVGLVSAFASLCDFGIASTDALARHLRQIVCKGQVIVHRNGLSPFLEHFARGSFSNGSAKTRRDVVVFYGSGTKAHATDFTTILEPALQHIMAKYPAARFCACGYVSPNGLQGKFPGRVDLFPLMTDYRAYIGIMNQCDIVVSILKPSDFNDCKSEIKWLEAAASALPTVASDVQGFREVLTSGHDILLAKPTVADWVVKLESLVTSSETRSLVGRHAARTAIDNYAAALLGSKLGHALGLMLPNNPAKLLPPQKEPTKPRLLLVNVFTHPQSIGGATRVFDEHVRVMATQYGNEFDIAVCCGNDDPADQYSIEKYTSRHGVAIYSINTPSRVFMDWIHEDQAVRPAFGRILDAFRPDIIHFHCIQRLTGTIAEVAYERGIPYFVSVHDAWWISDHQFLMDAKDHPILPCEWPHASEENPHPVQKRMARRFDLLSILRRARYVLPVSEAFSQIYRGCGITNVVTVSNGIGALPAMTEVGPRLERVRLGHIGGITHHKGYFLFRKAVAECSAINLDVMVIDHSMRDGEVRYETWGSTHVEICGRVPQERIQELYARLDVLVAPSIWPESFGLVTREACFYRKWIIASNRGAIGEVVIPGENGFIIDVTDTTELVSVLQQIDAKPTRYIQPTPAALNQRTSSMQVSEYVGLYRGTIASGQSKDDSGSDTDGVEVVEAVPTACSTTRLNPLLRPIAALPLRPRASSNPTLAGGART